MQQYPAIRSRLVGVNVPPVERIATGLLGGAAIAFGLRQRSLGGWIAAGVGALAVARAIAGRCPFYRARAIRKGVIVRRAITIQSTPEQVYAFWRDLTNLPRFMHHVESVTLEDAGVSRWVVREGRKRFEWRAAIVEDSPGRRLRWRSMPGGDIENEGTVEMREAPGDRGTVVEVKMRYFPPGGLAVASALYGFLQKIAAVQIGQELARLQQLLETGELTTGARRTEDLAQTDKAISAADVAPMQPAPVTTAQTSTWSGGAR